VLGSSNPIVSVVIPCYNQSRFLSTAIESVLAQSWRPTEIIVVDDGSTDSTAAVADQYGGRLTYHYKPNGGLASARNFGIRHATGTFLAFLDSDDWWHPRFLETVIGVLRHRQGPGLAYCRQQPVDQSGVPLATAVMNDAIVGNLVTALIAGNRVTADAVVVDAASVLRVGGFDESLRSNEDWDLWLRLAENGVPFIFVPRTLAYYRQHSGGLHLDLGPMYRSYVAVLEKHARARRDAAFRQAHREAMARGLSLQAVHAVSAHGVENALGLACEVARAYHEEVTGCPDHFVAMIDALSTTGPAGDGANACPHSLGAFAMLRTLPRALPSREYNELVGTVYLALAITQLRDHHWAGGARSVVLALWTAPRLAVHRGLRRWIGAVVHTKGLALLPYSLRPTARARMPKQVPMSRLKMTEHTGRSSVGA
jgi:GT2 family glycosyltransferase